MDKESQKYVRDRIKKEQASLEVDRWFEEELAKEKAQTPAQKPITSMHGDIQWPSL